MTSNHDELPVVFARHRGGSSSETSDTLWETQRIGIHWEDIPSSDPDDYERDRGRDEIRKLNEIAREGALVAASYRETTQNEMLVGAVPPDSNVELLFFNEGEVTSAEEVPPGEALETPPPGTEGATIEKALQLENPVVVRRDRFPVLFDDGIRPPHWSVCHWHAAEDHVRAAYEGEYAPFAVRSLAPAQLETVCEEFLRTLNPSYRSLSPTGGRLADVDLLGRDERGPIYAQVTGGDPKTVESKLEVLEDYTDEAHEVIMFAPEDSRPETVPEGMTYLPTEFVFRALKLDPAGESLLHHLLPSESGD